jgi:hypothetical protein
MVVSAEKIAQMELALEEAKAELQRQNGRKFDILWAWLPDDQKERFHDNLKSRHDRVLFGLEEPAGSERPAKSGGDLECPICHKSGLTKRGLALHMARKHKGELQHETEEAGLFKRGRASQHEAAS